MGCGWLHGPVQAVPMNILRILIVADDAMIATLLAETVAASGHVVCGMATTELGAVNAAERDKPDLIIIDVDLATGSGLRAIERIVWNGPVAHVSISGNRMPVGTHALLKPFRPAELLQAMDRALADAAQQSQPSLQIVTEPHR
jgi:DNA-binding response OmpR family regulator